MDLLFTTRYKVNRIFSAVISLITAFIGGAVAEGLRVAQINGINTIPFIAAGIFILLNFYLTRKYRRRKKVLITPFPDEWENKLSDKVMFYNRLNEDDRHLFRKKVQLFLDEVRITGVRAPDSSSDNNSGVRAPVDDDLKILIAAAAVIPVFRIPDWEYDMLDEVLVYPGNFDEDFNFSGSRRDILGMVVSRTSSVIISQEALVSGFARNDGENVALHEFMHKIDEGDGQIDGIPALFLSADEQVYWKQVVEDEMELLIHGGSDFNPYALKDRGEFFAVAGEYFFEKPQRMKEKHPSLYKIMCRMFRQDLASAIVDETKKSLGIRTLRKK
ncbi:MAG TPA: zinc-dependent peptidase [Spirochaetota bacterium]|nr:zinc-dependent peptidase [Spirochaetota bacterium]